MKKTVKVYLLNLAVLGQRCGYGEGKTREAAIADALSIARERDQAAAYSPSSHCVEFRTAVRI